MAVIKAAQLDTFRIELAQALQEHRLEDARRLIRELSPARVASVLTEALEDVVLPLLGLLDRRTAGRVVGAMPAEFAAAAVTRLETQELADVFAVMQADEAAAIYRRLPEEHQERLRSVLDDETLQMVSGLAKYPLGTAGAIMTTGLIAINLPATVGEVITLIQYAPPRYERTFYVYIVTEEGKLRGVVSLRDLVRYNPQQSVERAMTRGVIAVHVNDTAAEAARHMRNRRFLMLPVLNEHDILVGVITFDDAMEVLTQEVTGGFVRIGGGSPDESFFTPPLGAVWNRLPWMAMNVFLNLGAVAIISGFENTIAQVAILAAFLPMITDMGGNVGIQALSVAIRSIALGEVRIRDFWQAVRKEVAIGLVNGVALGALFGLIAFVLRGNPSIGVIAGVALGCNVLVAGVIGGTLPFLIKRLGKDPAMMTGPILTTITDITGVSIYLGLSTVFLLHILV